MKQSWNIKSKIWEMLNARCAIGGRKKEVMQDTKIP